MINAGVVWLGVENFKWNVMSCSNRVLNIPAQIKCLSFAINF